MRFLVILFFAALLCACKTTPQYETVDGILEVPENRKNPISRTLKLVYKVLKAKDTTSGKAPIVYLQGGPGAPTLIMEEFWKNHPLRNNRDIVLMDQRGTGKSGAYCAELGNRLFRNMRQNHSIEEDYIATANLFNECKKFIKQGKVDLAGYNSRENAADFEDLRKALGYKNWNLYGASYGSRLGLTIMRDFPNSVRSSVLIGVFPPQADLIGKMVSNFESSLNSVLRRCEENEDCNNRYPNLKERLLNILKELESEPMYLDYNGKPFVLNAQEASALIHLTLYSRHLIGNIPFFIEALETGEFAPIENELKRAEIVFGLINWAMNSSVMAYEELPFTNYEAKDKSLTQSEIGFGLTFNSSADELLRDWHSLRAAEIENQPVISDIPTLLVSGSLDPVTPPTIAKLALRHLKNGYEVVFPDESHEFINPCFFQIVNEFVNNPSQKPDSACSDVRNPIEWNLSNPLQ